MNHAKKANNTSFKKGKKNPNYRAPGSERVRASGYTEVKVEDENGKGTWVVKQRYIYEQHYGPIPQNSVILFADGDKTNFAIENLILVTREQLAYLNRYGLRTEDIELTKTAVNVVELMLQIGKLKKKR